MIGTNILPSVKLWRSMFLPTLPIAKYEYCLNIHCHFPQRWTFSPLHYADWREPYFGYHLWTLPFIFIDNGTMTDRQKTNGNYFVHPITIFSHFIYIYLLPFLHFSTVRIWCFCVVIEMENTLGFEWSGKKCRQELT